MQRSRRDHEAGSISESGSILWNLGSMSVTVKNCKEADETHRGRDRRLDVKRNDCTKRHNRKGYADLNKGNPDAGDAERTAGSHNHDKCHRNKPKCSPSELPREDAYHHHGEDVIKAGDRMPKST